MSTILAKAAEAIKDEGWYGEHFASSGHLHLTDEDAEVLARAALESVWNDLLDDFYGPEAVSAARAKCNVSK